MLFRSPEYIKTVKDLQSDVITSNFPRDFQLFSGIDA